MSGDITSGANRQAALDQLHADVYDRNVGVKSKLAIPRGINQLWTNGGILYAPPIR